MIKIINLDVLLLCCVQVQGAPGYSIGGGEKSAQKERAAWDVCTRRATAAVTGGPAECHTGPQ